MGNYNELLVWQRSVDFVVEIYSATSSFPRDEIFGLRLQMRRAAVSIPSNLAEGQGRSMTNDYRRFVLHARGSLLEIQTQIVICERLRYIEERVANDLRSQADEIGRMLNGLLHYLTPNA
jgi:four helix bundle protein